VLDKLAPGDFPANLLEKSGYRLEFNDEFEGPTIDTGKWVPFYLPHWSSRTQSAPRYSFDNGNLVLQITQDQAPWCPEFDGEIRCSSIQTGAFAGPVGSGLGQHKFSQACVVREAQPNVQLYTPQYGYFELRAKAAIGGADHVALWMIGYEDTPERSGEIPVCEIMGAYISSTSSRIGYGVHPWGDPHLKDDFYEDFLAIDASHYHLYAVEWTPTQLDFYLDNVKIRTIHQSPDYPMQFMLSIYERPGQGLATEGDDSYPKTFTVDYFRAYQPVRGYTTGATSG
jgi:hypothetical protein